MREILITQRIDRLVAHLENYRFAFLAESHFDLIALRRILQSVLGEDRDELLDLLAAALHSEHRRNIDAESLLPLGRQGFEGVSGLSHYIRNRDLGHRESVAGFLHPRQVD